MSKIGSSVIRDSGQSSELIQYWKLSFWSVFQWAMALYVNSRMC